MDEINIFLIAGALALLPILGIFAWSISRGDGDL